MNKNGRLNPLWSPSSFHLALVAIGAARTVVSSAADCQSMRVVHPVELSVVVGDLLLGLGGLGIVGGKYIGGLFGGD